MRIAPLPPSAKYSLPPLLLNTAFTNEYTVRQAPTRQIFFDGARGSTHEFLGLAGINHSAAAR